MLRGDIDLHWEYTGTAWVFLLEQRLIQDSAAQYRAVQARDLMQNKIVWLAPTPFDNTYAFAVKHELAQRLGLRTLSDMAAYLRSGRPGRISTTSALQRGTHHPPGCL